MSFAVMTLLFGAEQAKATKLKSHASMSLDEKVKNEIIEAMNEGISVDTVAKAIQEEKVDEEAVIKSEKKLKHAKSKK
jgi:hypothetical protein